MKHIDKYIVGRFLKTYLFSILILAFIIIVFDISEKIDDFTDERASGATIWDIIIDYYLNFVPFLINQFNALFVFISVIFFTSKMASKSEIIAIFNSGVSFYRLLLTYVLTAIALFAVNLLMTFWVIPEANKVRIDFENKYIRNAPYFNKKNTHVQIDSNSYVYFHSFNIKRNTAYKFSLEKFDGQNLIYKLNASFAVWDSTDNLWTIKNYHVREIDGMDEKLYSGNKLDTALNIQPRDFKAWLNNVQTMNQAELIKFIEREKFKGSNQVKEYEVEKHKRLAFPFASIILTIMGFSLASRKIRGGIGMHIGLGMLLCFTYILISQMAFVYAAQSDMNAIIGVWIPNILYTIITAILVYKAPK